MLIDYLNDRLDEAKRRRVVAHLASCGECRKEAALLIRLKNNQEMALKEVPQDIKLSAFDLVPKAQPQVKSLLAMLNLEPVYDSLKLVGVTMQFMKKMILIGGN